MMNNNMEKYVYIEFECTQCGIVNGLDVVIDYNTKSRDYNCEACGAILTKEYRKELDGRKENLGVLENVDLREYTHLRNLTIGKGCRILKGTTCTACRFIEHNDNWRDFMNGKCDWEG